MYVLICCDKFKSSLSAHEACHAIEHGIINKNPHLQTKIQAIADGGDGSLEIIALAMKLESILVNTIDPLGRPIQAAYLSDKNKAHIELASASGIARLCPSELDVMTSNTKGTGILINDALNKKHSEIILYLGGSASNDMGLGILQALGFTFENKKGASIVPCAATLSQIDKIIFPNTICHTKFTILTDVNIPLYGPHGAAQKYATQKGATNHDIKIIDKGMKHVTRLIEFSTNKKIHLLEGAGAAGGVAAGLIGLLHRSKLYNGFDYISKIVSLESLIELADVVISGEGQLDEQSFQGKVVGKVADLCKQHKKQFIICVGKSTLDTRELLQYGIHQNFSIVEIAKSSQDAIENAAKYLEIIGTKIIL